MLRRSSLPCFGNHNNRNLGGNINGPRHRAVAPRPAAWRRGQHGAACPARAGTIRQRIEHRNERRSRAARSHAGHVRYAVGDHPAFLRDAVYLRPRLQHRSVAGRRTAGDQRRRETLRHQAAQRRAVSRRQHDERRRRGGVAAAMGTLVATRTNAMGLFGFDIGEGSLDCRDRAEAALFSTAQPAGIPQWLAADHAEARCRRARSAEGLHRHRSIQADRVQARHLGARRQIRAICLPPGNPERICRPARGIGRRNPVPPYAQPDHACGRSAGRTVSLGRQPDPGKLCRHPWQARRGARRSDSGALGAVHHEQQERRDEQCAHSPRRTGGDQLHGRTDSGLRRQVVVETGRFDLSDRHRMVRCAMRRATIRATPPEGGFVTEAVRLQRRADPNFDQHAIRLPIQDRPGDRGQPHRGRLQDRPRGHRLGNDPATSAEP